MTPDLSPHVITPTVEWLAVLGGGPGSANSDHFPLLLGIQLKLKRVRANSRLLTSLYRLLIQPKPRKSARLLNIFLNVFGKNIKRGDKYLRNKKGVSFCKPHALKDHT